MNKWLIGFSGIDRTMGQQVGGKAANLGELSRLEGINVPPGCCISTAAYRSVCAYGSPVDQMIIRLSETGVREPGLIPGLCLEIRTMMEEVELPPGLDQETDRYFSGDYSGYFAIRSSATAEDLPHSSFAGLQDSFLNITGREAVFRHIRKCWASLFTERAVRYRTDQGFDHRQVQMAVVVQQMIDADSSGIMFTADPVSGNRKSVCIDAGFGLGESFVSGTANPDRYIVNAGSISNKTIAEKKTAIVSATRSGTRQIPIGDKDRMRQTLSDTEILQLAGLGRRIEKHFGSPQDIEWCVKAGQFYILQSRPVTTLYPIPVVQDSEKHVFVSVGHQQMMTDPMRPLGLSLFMLTAFRPMFPAGGRLFVDVAPELATPTGRNVLINVLGKSDPLIRDALKTITDRGDFGEPSAAAEAESGTWSRRMGTAPDGKPAVEDPAIVGRLMQANRASVTRLREEIRDKTGTALIDFILNDIPELRRLLFDREGMEVFMTAINASSDLNDKISDWLGDTNVADIITQSVSDNVTSEMALALLDVADVFRAWPEVIRYLENSGKDFAIDALAKLPGGEESQKTLADFLEKYGMRCAGEIDISNRRWAEDPAILVPVILSSIRNFQPGESARKFNRGKAAATAKEKELIERLAALPGAEEKIAETKRLIRLIRQFIGYREYPKYGKICRYFVYKQGLMQEANRMLEKKLIRQTDDIFYLTMEELRELTVTGHPDYALVDRRRAEQERNCKLSPPRVMTSDGEIVVGRYDRVNAAPGALTGLAVSAGTVEGRARILLTMTEADLEPGDILVTPFTDPGWTALFASIGGLVTEVGGLMTHGAVIAREYGLPAVVGVENATRLIRDGQRIRINGTAGFVELL